MLTTPDRSEAQPESSKPAHTKPPDIASASIPDTLVALRVNPETGLPAAIPDHAGKMQLGLIHRPLSQARATRGNRVSREAPMGGSRA